MIGEIRFVSEKRSIAGRAREVASTWDHRRTVTTDGRMMVMLPDRYLKDFLHELEALSGRYPADAKVISSHGVVAALDDDEAFEVLLRLVGPQAPAFADELWQLISSFLNSRRAEELFGGPGGTGWTHLNAVRRPRYIPPSTRPVIQQ